MVEQEKMMSKQIIEAHPELFGEPPFDVKKTLIGFGFECSSFWMPILKKGFGDISKIVKKENIIDFRVRQVKEKFGGLRIYCDNDNDEIDKIVDRMEEEVSTVCEICGAGNAELRTEGWMVTRCDECQKDWFEKQYK